MAEQSAEWIGEIKTTLESANDSQYNDAITMLHRYKYIGEIILNETDTCVTDDVVEQILGRSDPPTDRLERKVYNLGRAIEYMFPSSKQFGLEPCPPELLTPSYVQEVHRLVMDGLLDSAGSYRLTEAAPAGYEMYYYKSPSRIAPALEALCARTASKLSDAACVEHPTAEHIMSLTSIGADFLGTFLDIHPFSNGNGRTGRLLLSFIICSISIVPVSLCVASPKRSRDVYLDTLVQARMMSPHNYSTLQSLVLEAVHQNMAALHWWQS